MPRKLTFKASLRDMVDDTRSLDDIRPGEKLDVTLRKFIPQEFAAEVTYYDYAGRLTLDDAVWSGVENLANFSVSYTHLDVYKRQSACGPETSRPPAGSSRDARCSRASRNSPCARPSNGT